MKKWRSKLQNKNHPLGYRLPKITRMFQKRSCTRPHHRIPINSLGIKENRPIQYLSDINALNEVSKIWNKCIKNTVTRPNRTYKLRGRHRDCADDCREWPRCGFATVNFVLYTVVRHQQSSGILSHLFDVSSSQENCQIKIMHIT